MNHARIASRIESVLGRLLVPQRLLVSTAGSLVAESLLGCRDRVRQLATGTTFRRARVIAPVLLFGWTMVAVELQTSWIQSIAFPWLAGRLSYSIEAGRGDEPPRTQGGPLDERRGYTRIRELQRGLEAAGFQVVEQVRYSPGLKAATLWGISPPQPPPALAGLVIRDRHGDTLYDATADQHRFERYEDVPPLVVQAIMFIENRDLGRPRGARVNAAVDWGRFVRAAAFSVGNQLGFPLPFQGGSTLAIQMEKFRHSEGGRTSSGPEKLRQIMSASLAVYRDGPDTRLEQRRIVLDYLNSIPLAATPDWGEVFGLGNGLRAWFGLDPTTTFAALDSDDPERRAHAFRHVLALLCAVRAPSRYLVTDRAALLKRVDFYTEELSREGRIDDGFAAATIATPLVFAPKREGGDVHYDARKPIDLVRRQLLELLQAHDYYALDRLHVEVETTLEGALQDSVMRLLRRMHDPDFVRAHGLTAPRLLESGAPEDVIYSLRLLERGPDGDRVLVHADNLDRPFDVNEGMRIELGSTAKLRTLTHYLEIVGDLHEDMRRLNPGALARRVRTARDPITLWAAAQMRSYPAMPRDTLLARALARRYSASPGESFFTGGGVHVFHNFDPEEDGRTFTVREATVRSNNLVFVRLMRDMVRFHTARLPYDARAVLDGSDARRRRQFVREMADEEAVAHLRRAHRELAGLEGEALVARTLGGRPTAKRVAALYYAWHPRGSIDSLAAWMHRHGHDLDRETLERVAHAFGNPRFTLADYAYLLDRHALAVWYAGEQYRYGPMSWDAIAARSGRARALVSAWLFRPTQRRAQNVRLITRIERDAFERMTPYWRRLGFPFERLVPSYATAIGSSADRPEALAELMGVLVDDGARSRPEVVRRIRLAPGTPYHTVLENTGAHAEQVLDPAVAKAVRQVLADVVERGTARRMHGAFVGKDGEPIVVGGKTGSGDNRLDTYGPGGRLESSRAISRTAAFGFYVGDRHYGVITASVAGRDAEHFRFTSSLPLSVLRMLTPSIAPVVGAVPPQPAAARPVAALPDTVADGEPADGAHRPERAKAAGAHAVRDPAKIIIPYAPPPDSTESI